MSKFANDTSTEDQENGGKSCIFKKLDRNFTEN